MGFKYLMFFLADNYFLVITQVVEPNSGVKNTICLTQTCIMQYIAVKNSQQNRNLYSYITSIVISFMNMAGGGGGYKIMKNTNFPRVEPRRLVTCYLEIITVHAIKINYVAICLRLSHILK